MRAQRGQILVVRLAIAFFIFLLGNPIIWADSPTPYAFPVTRTELVELANTLADRVDLFHEVWQHDPEAEFYAGTTRDYLYFILGHFKGLKTPEAIAAAKRKLLDTPKLYFRDMVSPLSDADVMTRHREKLASLRGEDFAILKIEFVTFDRVDPRHELGQSEIDQGFVDTEKLRLAKSGLVDDPTFKDGISDLITGQLHLSLPEYAKFWQTKYAKEGSNHPVMLALRYLRIASQDYLKRHGDEFPDAEKLFAVMPPGVKESLQKVIADAILDKDGRFAALLKNESGKKWLNASIQKSFRSFTNATAAFELMKQMGALELIQSHPQKIASVLDYLLQVKRDESAISAAFLKYKITDPNQVYQPIENYLTADRELLHGAGSEEAFRGLIYQGVIPSEANRSAGRGLYGVRPEDIEFAKKWSRDRAKTDDIVVALKLKASTKVIDISQGEGGKLFNKWSAKHGADYDKFAQVFGADLLVYQYTDALLPKSQAFVLKNASVIEAKRGVFKQPRPIHEFEVALKKLGETWAADTSSKDLSKALPLLRDFLMTPLLKGERSRLLGVLPDDLLKALLLKENREEVFRSFQTNEISTLLSCTLDNKIFHPIAEAFLVDHLNSHRTPEGIQILNQIPIWPETVWTLVPSLLKDPDASVSYQMTDVLRSQPSWLSTFWQLVPSLLMDPDPIVRSSMTDALQSQSSWPDTVWALVPSLLKDPEPSMRYEMAETLRWQSSWPVAVWTLVPGLLKDPDVDMSYVMLKALQSQTSWLDTFWQIVPSLLMDPDPSVRHAMAEALQSQSSWPDTVWTLVPSLLKDHDPIVRDFMVTALKSQATWPDSFMKQLPRLLNDRKTAELLAPLVKERGIELPPKPSCLTSLKTLALRFISAISNLRRAP